ncbi:MAG: hypothetical protein GX027_03260 [Clostridiaceae bacterium]|jgi:hypothetical protein|nr:hypothetical protein [Clostridiaceae bacterium]
MQFHILPDEYQEYRFRSVKKPVAGFMSTTRHTDRIYMMEQGRIMKEPLRTW